MSSPLLRAKLRPLRIAALTATVATLVAATACGPAVIGIVAGSGGGGGGGGSAIGTGQPDFQSYQFTNSIYAMHVPIQENMPEGNNLERVEAFTVQPALPKGLQLDRDTGRIHGIPEAPAEHRSYTITASFRGGKKTTVIGLQVLVALATGGAGTNHARLIAPAHVTAPHPSCDSCGASDGFLIAGPYSGSFALGQDTFTSTGKNDIFLARFRSDGSLCWVKDIKGPGEDLPNDLVVAQDGTFTLVGFFNGSEIVFDPTHKISLEDEITDFESGDGFVARFTCDGEVDWLRGIHGDYKDQPFEADLLPDGSLVIAGEFSQVVSFDNGEGGRFEIDENRNGVEAFIALYDDGGVLKWVREFGDAVPPGSPDPVERASGLAVTADGIYLAGDFNGDIHFDGITLETDGTGNHRTLFLSLLDTAGNVQWARDVSAPPDSRANQPKLSAYPAGDILLSSEFFGSLDFGLGWAVASATKQDPAYVECVLARFDPSGAVLWAKSFVGEGIPNCNTGGSCAVGNRTPRALTRLDPLEGEMFAMVGSFDLSVDVDLEDAATLRLREQEADGVHKRDTTDAFFALYKDELGAPDPSPRLQWALRGGGNRIDEGRSLGFLPDGALIVCGSFVGSKEDQVVFRDSLGERRLELATPSSNVKGYVIVYDRDGVFR